MNSSGAAAMPIPADNGQYMSEPPPKTAFETMKEKVAAGVEVVKEKASGLVEKVREATSRGNSQENDKPL
jgi:hypothetical protein